MGTIGFVCPVCGFPDLPEPAWDIGGSQEICPSCGTQFGYHDAAGRTDSDRAQIHKELRERWIADGMMWQSGQPPTGWDPVRQLARLSL